jgi:subtilase family serine protease
VNGAGRTIVIIGVQSTTVKSQETSIDVLASLHRFDHVFGLPDPPFSMIAPFGGMLTKSGAAYEAVLDIEMAHTIAPGAGIEVLMPPAEANASRTQGQEFQSLLLAIRYAVRHELGDIISISFGMGENCMTSKTLQALHFVMREARLRHISVVASSGDNGSVTSVCSRSSRHVARSVVLPAADSLVTSVGGTTLLADAVSGMYIEETVWNQEVNLNVKQPSLRQTFTQGTGGGFSRVYARPSFQDKVPGARQHRAIPDVAFDADPRTGIPLTAVAQGHTAYLQSGGTSMGAPAWAGIIALADEFAHRRLGFLNDAIYRIGAGNEYKRAFHDVLHGNNTFAGSGPKGSRLRITGFSAGPGWDPVTGWGTPKVSTLVPLLGEYTRPGDGNGL